MVIVLVLAVVGVLLEGIRASSSGSGSVSIVAR